VDRQPAKSFVDLVVWQKAHQFVLSVYQCTRAFPREELYGLTSQLRRAAVSVPANIAEGFCKRSLTDKARFFNIAEGSLSECRYYVLLANDLGYKPNSDAMTTMMDEIGRLLNAYATTLRSRSVS
jgi:four helix bundle protein